METLITAREARKQSESNLKEALSQYEIPQDIIDSINHRIACGDTELYVNHIGFDIKLRLKLKEIGYKIEDIRHPDSIMVIGIKISW
jgi:hypothetical protein